MSLTLSSDKQLNILMHGTPSYVIIQEL